MDPMKSNHLPVEQAAFQPVDVMLTPLRKLFSQAALALARTCSTQGALDPALLDRWQVPAYELAFASADLLAAETLAASATGDGIDAGLARLFIIDAIAAVIARLETVCLETGHDIGALHALAALPAFTALRRAAGSTTALAQLALAVVAAQGDIGQVELAQSVAMASGAFERFAAAMIFWQSATVDAIGFSRNTCLPASSAAIAGSVCWSHIVTIETASISGSAIISR